jgi:ABC-type transport system substrate-binding protein
MGRDPLGLVLVGVVALLASCAPAPQATSTAPATNNTPAQPAAKKRVVAAVNGNLFTVSGMLSVGGTGTATQGTAEVEKLTNAGFTTKGLTQPLEAQLAETVPTLDNGLWKVTPDGRMEMTWKIRAGAKWQDGQPVTADDVVFTSRIGQDAELAFVRDRKYKEIEGIDAPDPRTVVVRWNQTDIEADQMFGTGGTLPLPKHLLEESYNANKATFLQQGFWSSDFVGSGPYRVANWQDGIGTLLVASDGYALGRPKIDEIEVKFISNSPTEVANILAGAVEMTFGRGLSQDQAATLREQWKDGSVQVYGSNPNIITPST